MSGKGAFPGMVMLMIGPAVMMRGPFTSPDWMAFFEFHVGEAASVRSHGHQRGVAGVQAGGGAEEGDHHLMLQSPLRIRKVNVAVNQAGSTVAWLRSITFAPAGIFTRSAGPTSVILSPVISTT